ncbi:hypothetical protein CGCSCA4_v007370 [Colletotrichum siamense]|uniref:Uncharacterized protein n=1 Tax=Colletotrichum siamense TaxID=690259 RepID=A0A9P5ESI3_COLSI|nr:uncharacterized protein CGCS363_v008862 [Colletotrichum siamense]KAF4844389.1 hypothetical protein CGCSCA4_v007370 [Colletotrichum siamense]KAF4858734.1 hypothetical protein CGCSCA2_v006920 [Colletotrichum siamense]KAF4872641.1 hypothetical protein CGCSCA1_v008358 [Colletotrichum siamense]KAF5497526.1 hypothetical protein CGCS363_v008862 [Colletotrichum siamense]
MHRQLAYPSCGELLAQIKTFPRIQKSVPFSEAGGQPLSTFVLFRCQDRQQRRGRRVAKVQARLKCSLHRSPAVDHGSSPDSVHGSVSRSASAESDRS